MNSKRLIVGELRTNCYILEKNNKCIIIDPGDNFEYIKANINKVVVGIIVTHYHFDHIGALNNCLDYYNTKVYDYKNLKIGHNKIEDFEFEVIYTPGHKNDLISIYFKETNALYCGDFIFKNSIGRCDLKEGDFNKMKMSIKNILKQIPSNTIIYPGHGNTTTLKDEIKMLKYYINIF